MRKKKAVTESAGAKRVGEELDRLGVSYAKEVKFTDCRDARCLPFDFQIAVEGRIGLIEFDGAQHFAPSSLYHKRPGDFAKEQQHDRTKTAYAAENGISLLRLAYDLDEGALREGVRRFVAEVPKKSGAVTFLSTNPRLYEYLAVRKPSRGCVLL